MVGSKGDHDRMTTSHDDVAAVSAFLVEPPLSPDPSSSVSCSICLDVVLNDGERSCAKLKCGHQFHLDCIGSAFNMKGAMQCPNCRTVEKGHWLYANDTAQAVPEYNINDWIPDQEPHEVPFPGLPFRVHWCPFNGLAGYRPVLEDVDTPSAMYQGLPEHALFAEPSAASSVSHLYAAYIGQPPLSNATDSLDEPVFNHPWNVITHGDIPVPHGFPAMDFQYQSWIHRHLQTSGHIDGIDQVPNSTLAMRPMRDEPVTRSTSSTHPLLLGQGSGTLALGPLIPSVVPLPMGRSHERIIHVPPPLVFQQSGSASAIPPHVQHNRRYYFDRRQSVVPEPSAHLDQNGGYYGMNPLVMRNHHEGLHPVPSHIHSWNRVPASSLDSVDHWPTLHESVGRFESGNNRSGSVWQTQRH
ncbi:unnamed protein product [Rhodiola kirilowii]